MKIWKFIAKASTVCKLTATAFLSFIAMEANAGTTASLPTTDTQNNIAADFSRQDAILAATFYTIETDQSDLLEGWTGNDPIIQRILNKYGITDTDKASSETKLTHADTDTLKNLYRETMRVKGEATNESDIATLDNFLYTLRVIGMWRDDRIDLEVIFAQEQADKIKTLEEEVAAIDAATKAAKKEVEVKKPWLEAVVKEVEDIDAKTEAAKKEVAAKDKELKAVQEINKSFQPKK